MIYWSLYLVITVAGSGLDDQYVGIVSYDNRMACEGATKFKNEQIVQFGKIGIRLRCLKTDGPVTNELIMLRETAEPDN